MASNPRPEEMASDALFFHATSRRILPRDQPPARRLVTLMVDAEDAGVGAEAPIYELHSYFFTIVCMMGSFSIPTSYALLATSARMSIRPC